MKIGGLSPWAVCIVTNGRVFRCAASKLPPKRNPKYSDSSLLSRPSRFWFGNPPSCRCVSVRAFLKLPEQNRLWYGPRGLFHPMYIQQLQQHSNKTGLQAVSYLCIWSKVVADMLPLQISACKDQAKKQKTCGNGPWLSKTYTSQKASKASCW